MSERGSPGRSGAGSAAAGPGPAPGAGAGAAHPRSFKLRFAAQREPGRSYVSAVKPLGVPATVTGKFYARAQRGDVPAAAEERALAALRRVFEGGRAGAAHATSAQECGRWWRRGAAPDPRLRHPIADSAWLKERLRVLAEPARR